MEKNDLIDFFVGFPFKEHPELNGFIQGFCIVWLILIQIAAINIFIWVAKGIM